MIFDKKHAEVETSMLRYVHDYNGITDQFELKPKVAILDTGDSYNVSRARKYWPLRKQIELN